jgi:hypothetical protein
LGGALGSDAFEEDRSGLRGEILIYELSFECPAEHCLPKTWEPLLLMACDSLDLLCHGKQAVNFGDNAPLLCQRRNGNVKRENLWEVDRRVYAALAKSKQCL